MLAACVVVGRSVAMAHRAPTPSSPTSPCRDVCWVTQLEYETLRARELRNQQDVLDQIAARKEAQEALEKVKFREKEKVAKKEAARAIRIQMLKDRKLKELEEEGITFEEQARAGLLAPDRERIW